MRWASNWRIYYIAATLFLIAALISFFNGGLTLRPVLGLVMAAALVLIGNKARGENEGELPPG
jgi:hypothetical protein